jgi:predicted nucleic acid-binding protein
MPTVPRAADALLLDTSAAVALVLVDHEWHDAAVAAVSGRRLGLAGHAWFETYSVLTRLPPTLRRSPSDAYRVLSHNFPESRFLEVAQTEALCSELVRLAVSGGAIYDALVGAAARYHGLELLSGDRRAKPTYDALGVDLQLLP